MRINEQTGVSEGRKTMAAASAVPSSLKVDSAPDAGATERVVRSQQAPLLAELVQQRTTRAFGRIASLLVIDYLSIGAALIGWLSLKAWLKGNFDWAVVNQQVDRYITFAFLVSVLMFARHDLYKERARRPGLPGIANALFQVSIVALVFALANGEKFNSYSVFFGTLACAIITVTASRAIHDRVTARISAATGISSRALVVGTGDHAESVANTVGDSARWPVTVIGGVTAPADLLNRLKTEEVDEVIIAEPAIPQEQVIELAELCHRRGIEVHVAPTTMEILLQRAEFRPGMAVPLFTLQPPVFAGLEFAVKRAFDIVGAVLLLILLSPVLAASALAVKLSSKGPLLYRSMRPGIGEKTFACLKFRTMSEDADLRIEDLEQFNEADGALFKMRKDPRVTTVGKYLRRFSIDELPQLWNVLRGDMSLVGPRPLPMRDFELLEDWHRQRYQVLPGITGLWQVSGRSDLDFDDLVRLDFVYLERWSVGLDLLILLKTFPAVVARHGAY